MSLLTQLLLFFTGGVSGACHDVVRSTPYPALGEAGTKGNSLWGDACHAIESRGHRGPGHGGWHVFGDMPTHV